MTNTKKRVALPIETKVRELNGKLWLAAHLAERGYQVAIGELSNIKKNLSLFKPHIYIGDSAVEKKSRIELYRRLKQANVLVVVHDTEGGIIYSHDYYKGRLSKNVLESVDCFLAWGEETEGIFRDVWEDENIVAAPVGNPAFDLLSSKYRNFYEKETTLLQERFGRFVLVNTHFGFYNHYDRDSYVEPLRGKFPGLFTFKKKLFYAFVDAILNLCEANESINFVIRPHPSEDFSRYRDIFQKSNNVFVEHDLSVHPWAIAASLVFHNGCTTGVEAALLERPVVSYRPVTDDKWDVYLPNFVSQQAETVPELQNYIDTYCTSSPLEVKLDDEKKRVLQRILHVQDGRSAERICDVFDLLQCSWDIDIDKHPSKSVIKYPKYVLQNVLNRMKKVGVSKTTQGYAKQKFSQITYEELEGLLKIFKSIHPALENVTLARADGCDDIFWVSAESSPV